MGQLAFKASVTEEQAWQAIQARAPRISRIRAELRHHPFSGFVHRFYHPVHGASAPARVHTLVDRLTGKAFISEPWSELVEVDEASQGSSVSDPGWNTITFEQARERSLQVIRVAALRRYRLARRHALEELESHELLWKPNWLLTGMLGQQRLRVLVDGLTGSYYVVES
ncbi:MAG TPA: hypothetical protein VKZ85_12805 [Woeseiaceae bacterium]|nr:hypothetical protein [Woeseiaceae bacterium]